MSISAMRQRFIDRTARKPQGNWATKNYAAPKGHYRSFRIILDLLNLSSTDSYCEIGCGGGVLLGMALEKVDRAAAIDHSEDMVALSMRNNQKALEAGRVQIIQGDAAKLPWENDSFSTCACANMFFFIEEPEQMLAEIARILKPQGRFALATMGKSIIGTLSFGLLYGLHTYSDKTMSAMLSQAGFTNIRVKTKLFGLQICYAEKTQGDSNEQSVSI